MSETRSVFFRIGRDILRESDWVSGRAKVDDDKPLVFSGGCGPVEDFRLAVNAGGLWCTGGFFNPGRVKLYPVRISLSEELFRESVERCPERGWASTPNRGAILGGASRTDFGAFPWGISRLAAGVPFLVELSGVSLRFEVDDGVESWRGVSVTVEVVFLLLCGR